MIDHDVSNSSLQILSVCYRLPHGQGHEKGVVWSQSRNHEQDGGNEVFRVSMSSQNNSDNTYRWVSARKILTPMR